MLRGTVRKVHEKLMFKPLHKNITAYQRYASWSRNLPSWYCDVTLFHIITNKYSRNKILISQDLSRAHAGNVKPWEKRCILILTVMPRMFEEGSKAIVSLTLNTIYNTRRGQASVNSELYILDILSHTDWFQIVLGLRHRYFSVFWCRVQ